MNVAAFPADFGLPFDALAPWRKWLPSSEALSTANYALWEYLGLLFDQRRFSGP
jgi:hypothetical protein